MMKMSLILQLLLLVLPLSTLSVGTSSMTFVVVDAAAAVTSFSLDRSYPREMVTADGKHILWPQIRGGEQDDADEDVDDDDDDDDDNEDDAEGVTTSTSEESPEGDDDLISVDKTPSIINEKSRNSKLKLSGPFRILHEIREEAVSLAQMVPEFGKDKEEPPVTFREEVDDNAEDEESSSAAGTSNTARSLVGGASVVVKQTSRNTSLVGAPASMQVDTSRVAPLSLRLLEESFTEEGGDGKEAIEEGRDPIAEKMPKENGTQITKLWWVNLRQQLSEIDTMEVPLKEDEESEEEEESLSSSDVSGEEQEEDEDEGETIDALALVSADIQISMDEAKVDVELDEETGFLSLPLESKDEESPPAEYSSFVSSGLWVPIDNLLTLGLASKVPSLRISSKLRTVRKMSARVTGLHGFLSRKPNRLVPGSTELDDGADIDTDDMQKRMAAIEKIRGDVEGLGQASELHTSRRRRFGFGRQARAARDEERTKNEILEAEKKLREEAMEEKRRKEEEAKDEARRMVRVKEIDRLISEGQVRLQQLICEKDVLQRRLNPLYNYTTETVSLPENEESEFESTTRIEASRTFKFPPDDLVEEYLDMAFSSRRLTKMNHTDLWQDAEMEDDDDESIGDDLLTPSVDAHKLYQDMASRDKSSSSGKQAKGRNGSGGSWLLRQTLGKGPSIGEKIGEVAETAAYKAVCTAVMAFLARALSSLHGVNVMKHSDIRLVLEQAPDLPRVGEGIIPGSSSDYAQETIKTVMRRKAKKHKRRSKYQAFEDSFVQRDAVTEMLLSHVQISAPLLKLFPLAWQRAFLGNIITLSTAIMADFFEGLQFQILGHSLTFAFAPITQEDMINHLGLSGLGFNHRRAKADEFEAAVRATAEDVGEELKFLDRWHERALGSGVLRTQIANLIARIVLTLTDEVLSGARMDLWSAQAGGPRMLAGLEYRTTTTPL